MAHGYSLRPNSKGRRRHQNTDETKEQVEGSTSTSSASTSTTSTSEERHQTLTDRLEGESGTVDPRPATPDTPRARASHNPPWTWHSRNIATSSAISAPTTSRQHIDGPPEAIQAARKREEARRTAEAVRIRREQIVRGYEEELRMLHARIGALRRECDLKVERATMKAERKWASERGEVEVVVEDDEDGEEGNLVGEDADDGEMAVDKHNAHTQTTSLTTNHDDDKQQWQWSSRSSISAHSWSHRSESNFPPPLPLRKSQEQQNLSQRQQQEVDERGPGKIHTVSHTSRQLLQKNHPSQGPTSSPSRPRPHHPQPLRRQRTQLMTNPTSSHSHGLHTYGTAVLDPETEIRFGGTDGDNDSEMDG